MRVRLEQWTADDLELLRRANSPELTRYLGGPEAQDALRKRHEEYLAGVGVRMHRVVVDGEPAGYAGWWEQDHEGEPAYEVGCVIEPAWQGRGLATSVLREVVRRAVAEADGRPIVGYAHAENEASHALCRRVGFELEGTGLFPDEHGGEPVRVNVWVIRPR